MSQRNKAAILVAAALEQTTATEFVRGAVLDRVPHLQVRADRTLMSAEQFDVLVAALDVPEDAPSLARAFARDRRFVQR
ncbi:DUF1778 domain-containing protein [Intrasporangium sp.]|uniref:type II toxin -antitoxin system TacA 1-like antitoxin n=1 Tax=Intrasporangium sp. TaxID=1925024 RepID=UPI0032217A20